jgi:two-component system, cell cycle response regulator
MLLPGAIGSSARMDRANRPASALHSGKRVTGTVLIIDESRAEAAVLAKALWREGYVTRRAVDPAQALGKVGGVRSPDIVLMSVRPTDAGWSDALRAMKERVHPKFLPVTVLSSQTDVTSRVAALRAGADDVVAKPCPSAEIVARVAAMLRIKSSQDALELARMEAERLSITDPLTGLFNRRYFQYRLEQELERARRHGGPVSLLVLDLDHFKHVNDRYGHRAGDDALRLTAELLTRELRRLDVCTRWGGEEFAIILPNTGGPGAMVVAQRLVRALRAKARLSAPPLTEPDGRPEPVQITASLGLAAFPSPGIESAEALVQAADSAMYRAKDSGRNRICAVDSERGHPSGAEVLRFVPAPLSLAAAR